MTARYVSALVIVTLLTASTGLVPGRAADAQTPQPPKVYIEALLQGLREHGYVEGQTMVWDVRATDGSLDQLPQYAAELVRLNVDVILARASSGALTAKRATTSIPIVFFAVYAPVEIGLVPNLAHPGGNITGVAVNASDMAGKRVQLLKELVPTLKRVAMFSHPPHPTNAVQLRGAEAASRTVGVQLEAVPVRGADDFAPALKRLRGVDGVLNADTPLFVTHRNRLVDAAAATRLPAIYPAQAYVEAGGLMSYGPNLPEVWKRAAVYVDKILKGTKQPATFELAINHRTARALGLTFPPSIRVRADHIVD